MKSKSQQSKTSSSQKHQREHYHRKGSLAACIGLIEWHLRNHKDMPDKIKHPLIVAQSQLRHVLMLEAKNNEFVNLKKSFKTVERMKQSGMRRVK